MDEKIDTAMASLNLADQGKDAGPTSSMELTVLDPRGDLRLEVGSERRPFLVDSRSLSRASPVWNKMLNGGWAESKPANGDAWVITLPEDDPHAIGILLGIIHGDFPRAPELYTLDQLHRLTLSADKYDIVRVLRPWAGMWMTDLKQGFDGSRTSAMAPEFQNYLFAMRVAWDLGDGTVFEFMVRRILLEAEVNSDGALVDPDGDPLEYDTSVSGIEILETLATRRIELIESILQPLDELLQQLIDGEHRCSISLFGKLDPQEEEKIRSDCSMVILGTLAQKLSESYLFPLPGGDDVFESVESLAAKLRDLLTDVQPIGKKGSTPHSSCNPCPAVQTAMKGILGEKSAAIVTTDALRDHLSIQAEKTGCAAGFSILAYQRLAKSFVGPKEKKKA